MPGILSLVEELTAGTRLALPYIKSLAETSISANKIVEHLRESALPARRSDVLKAVRFFRDQAPSVDYIKALRNDYLPNPERFAEAASNTIRNFTYQVRVTGRSTVTGEAITKFVTVATNSVWTKSQVLNNAALIVLGNVDQYEVDVEDMVVDNATRSPDAVF